MTKKLLITFGCSWTYGYGLGYHNGLDKKEYYKIINDCTLADEYSFRGILSKNFGYTNLNFSAPGTSNQTQFRYAENFFGSPKFDMLVKEYEEVRVLWGITSLFRNDSYFPKEKIQKSFMYHDKTLLSKVLLTDHFEIKNEVSILAKKIKFWNKFFNLSRVKVLWFDTFNHHNYLNNVVMEDYKSVSGPDWPSWEKFSTGDINEISKKIKLEMFHSKNWNFNESFYNSVENFFLAHKDPRDLLSQLALLYGMIDLDNRYHMSYYSSDNDKVKYLSQKEILNPYSFHPTKLGHEEIAKLLSNFFEN